MSLLNQVLKDLDARQQGGRQPALLTAAPSPREYPVDDFGGSGWREWVRPGAWGIALLIAVLAAWAFGPSWGPFRAADLDVSSQHLQLPTPTRSRIGDFPASTTFAVSSEESASRSPKSESDDRRDSEFESGHTVNPRRTGHESSLPLRNAVMPVDKPTTQQKATGGDGVPDSSTIKSIRPVAEAPMHAVRRVVAEGSLAQAEVMLRQRLHEAPADLDARELLVGLMLRGDRRGDALDALDAGLRQHPRHGSFILIKARLLAQGNDPEGAIALLERGAGISEIRGNRLQMLGALYQQTGSFDKAAEHYRTLLSIQPGNAAGWAGLAITLDATGSNEAVAAYRRARDLGGLPDAAAEYLDRRLAEME